MPITIIGSGGVSCVSGIRAVVGVKMKGGSVPALSFVVQPQSKTVDEYALATFSCEVTGGVAPYSYQWKKNGANVGTNSANLSFAAAATDKNASITVVVTDSAGAVITSTSAVLGVTSYAFRLDGVSQYILLSAPISLPQNSSFEIKVIAMRSGSSWGNLVSGSNFRISAAGASDNYRLRGDVVSSANIFTTSNNSWPNDTTSRNVAVSRNASLIMSATLNQEQSTTLSTDGRVLFVERMGRDGGIGGNDYLNGYVYGFEIYINGVLTHTIPINNKSQGANQLATVGSINATIVNYNANGWVAI